MYTVFFKTQPDFYGDYDMGYIGMADGLWTITDEPCGMPLNWTEKAIAWFTKDRFRDGISPTWIENASFTLRRFPYAD